MTSKVSLVYLFPSQISQVIQTSGKKFISSLIDPPPRQASHLPPFTLNEKCPGVYPLSFANLVSENNLRISSNAFVYVAGFDLGVRPIGDWSITITLSTLSMPSISSCDPGTESLPCRLL